MKYKLYVKSQTYESDYEDSIEADSKDEAITKLNEALDLSDLGVEMITNEMVELA